MLVIGIQVESLEEIVGTVSDNLIFSAGIFYISRLFSWLDNKLVSATVFHMSRGKVKNKAKFSWATDYFKIMNLK